MKTKIFLSLLCIGILCFLIFKATITEAQENPFETPKSLVENTYKAMSFEKGGTFNWDLWEKSLYKESITYSFNEKGELVVMNRDAYRKYVQYIVDYFKDKGLKITPIAIQYQEFKNFASGYIIFNQKTLDNSYNESGIASVQFIKENGSWCFLSAFIYAFGKEPIIPDYLKPEYEYFLQITNKTDNKLTESPAALVQRQVEAYRARDINAFMDTYTDDIELLDGTGKLLVKGKEQMRPHYVQLFDENPDLFCEIKNTLVLGNWVVMEEFVKTSKVELNAIAVYEIANGKIKKVTFLNR